MAEAFDSYLSARSDIESAEAFIAFICAPSSARDLPMFSRAVVTLFICNNAKAISAASFAPEVKSSLAPVKLNAGPADEAADAVAAPVATSPTAALSASAADAALSQ